MATKKVATKKVEEVAIKKVEKVAKVVKVVKAEKVAEVSDTPKVVPVDHGDVVSIYRTVSSEGDGILNVCFTDGTEGQHPCNDVKWEAFQADETDWAKKAKKFYGSL